MATAGSFELQQFLWIWIIILHGADRSFWNTDVWLPDTVRRSSRPFVNFLMTTLFCSKLSWSSLFCCYVLFWIIIWIPLYSRVGVSWSQLMHSVSSASLRWFIILSDFWFNCLTEALMVFLLLESNSICIQALNENHMDTLNTDSPSHFSADKK